MRMAIYHFSAKVFQRSAGRSAVAAAAYRAGAKIYDERLGRTYNYSAKPGVIHSEILLPQGAPERWRDRTLLWNEVEAIERRKDAQLAREIELSLPRELPRAEAIALAREFVERECVARGMVADLNIHWSQDKDGEVQPHAHVMLSLRKMDDDGFGNKQRDWNSKALLCAWRENWAALVNEWLSEAGHDIRIDHRSYADQVLDLEPQNKIGPAGARRAQRGEAAERTDEHRAIARRNGERLLVDPGLALEVLTRQQSTFTRQDLARFLHRQTDGADQFSSVLAKVEASPELVKVGVDGRGQARFSTRTMVAIELRLIETALTLDQRLSHPVEACHRKGALEATSLREEQKLALVHVTRSRDLTLVAGIAGGGKSTLFAEARKLWEAEGYRVRGAALSGIAAEGLERGSGIASRTLASLEHAWMQGREELGPRDILVVDEAGMLGSRQLGQLLEKVKETGAKLVLSGDWKQLQAIEAGAPLRAIAERLDVAAIEEPQRQHFVWQKEATRALAAGRIEAAFTAYEQAGQVHGHETEEKAERALIEIWARERRQAPAQSRIILAHTRAAVRSLNDQARACRIAAGELGKEHHLATAQGERRMAEGERIYFLKNDRGLGVKNGTLGTLERITEGSLTVRVDGKAEPIRFALSDYDAIDHGYAATIHKSQGVTVDRAHVLASPGMDRHLAYVALSRHRDGVHLHWSGESFKDRLALIARLSRERGKDTSLDYQDSPLAAYAERRGIMAETEPETPTPEAASFVGGKLEVAEEPSPEMVDQAAVPPASGEEPEPFLSLKKAAQAAYRKQLAAAWPEEMINRHLSRPHSLLRSEILDELETAFTAPDLWKLPSFQEDRLPFAGLAAVSSKAGHDSFGRTGSREESAAYAARDAEVHRRLSAFSSHLYAVYRTPDKAHARLRALEQREGSIEAAVNVLEQQGARMLGGLRGGKTHWREDFALSLRAERLWAETSAGRTGYLFGQLREAEERVAGLYRSEVNAQRERDKNAIPPLSGQAVSILEKWEQAGVPQDLNEATLWQVRPTVQHMSLAAKVVPFWRQLQHRHHELFRELRTFGEAVLARFPLESIASLKLVKPKPFAEPDWLRPFMARAGLIRTVKMLDRCHDHYRDLVLHEKIARVDDPFWEARTSSKKEAQVSGAPETGQEQRAMSARTMALPPVQIPTAPEREETRPDPRRAGELRMLRERLVKAHMNQWWAHHRSHETYEDQAVTRARFAEARQEEKRKEQEIAVLPETELRRLEAERERREQRATARPSASPEPGF